MKESEFENILERYPDLIEKDLAIEGRQVAIGQLHVDLLYIDRFGQRLVVELKQGPILRQHIAQLFDYEGHFLSPGNPNVRIMLIGNRVPPNMRRSLEHHRFSSERIPRSLGLSIVWRPGNIEFLKYFDETTPPTTPFVPPVGIKPAPSNSGIKKIAEKFYALFAFNNLGEIRTRKEIIEMVLAAFPGTNSSSVIPSDYCYNITNAGIKFQHHLFEYLEDSRYRVLGKDYPLVQFLYPMEKPERLVNGKRVPNAQPFTEKSQDEIKTAQPTGCSQSPILRALAGPGMEREILNKCNCPAGAWSNGSSRHAFAHSSSWALSLIGG